MILESFLESCGEIVYYGIRSAAGEEVRPVQSCRIKNRIKEGMQDEGCLCGMPGKG